MDLCKLDILTAHKALINKEISALELTNAFLERIKKKDKEISAFLEVSEDQALKKAKEIDEMIAKGEKLSLLAGIPMAVKDNILVKGTKTTCGSKILENYNSPYDATCIKKLKEKGVVILGKTNLDEFAMGASTENSAFFPTKNPYDLDRVPGGSSGGSCAAVSADLCCFALGSDTGGSIRQPASFCGVIGLKPTYGTVSRYGLVAFASSLDQIGPITKTLKDAEIVFEVISGKDPLDSTSIDFQFSPKDIDLKNIKAGVPKEYLVEGIDKEVKEAFTEAIEKAKKQGIKIEEISLPHTKYALSVYYLIATSEASANLARYDGIKYGFSSEKAKDLQEIYFQSRGRGFGKEVKRRIMLGTFALSAGYYDAYYLKAEKVRTLIKSDFLQVFKKVDIILTPVSPTLPFKLGEKINDPLQMYLSDIFTVSASLAGLPALSVPVAFKQNLPVGLQIIGKYFHENTILKVGRVFSIRDTAKD